MNKEDLIKLADHDEAKVRQLAVAYMAILSNPYYDAYVTLKGQMDDWNSQLRLGEWQTIKIGDIDCETRKGKVDLFADKDSKEFERSFKYLENILEFADRLDKIRAKLAPEEAKKAIEEQTGVSYENARGKALGKK